MATRFDAVAASELRDTQGEILDVKGADISELVAGRGVVNDNHSNKLPDVVGRITSAKKIFGLDDCETERQRYYWNKIKAPYIFTEGLLYDDEDHRSAKAAAAILKHQFRTDSPLKLKCSVEGGIVERGEKDQRVLKHTKIRGLALTMSPANNATLVEGLDLAKSAPTVNEIDLIKSYVPFAVQDVPALMDLSKRASIAKIRENVEKINEMVGGLKKNISLVEPLEKAYLKQKGLTKALTAGYGGARLNESLKKDAAKNLQPLAGIPHGTHDVEVHPLVDHLKRVKGVIGDKPYMKVKDLSKVVTPDVMKHVPRDAKGNVTSQAIDSHIDSLPKFKVRAVVKPYTWGAQMHSPNAQEDVVSVHIHPDTWGKMDDRTKKHFSDLADKQHDFNHGSNQMGWARIDQQSGAPDHMHVDEIQSDFVNHDKIGMLSSAYSAFHDEDSVDKMHNFLSHGHSDPQHLIHSVVNELGRRHGIKSVSMDTPEDQVKQSGLALTVGRARRDVVRNLRDDIFDQVINHPEFREAHNQQYDTHLHPDVVESQRQNAQNPYLRSALKKINGQTLDFVKEHLKLSYGDSEPSLDVPNIVAIASLPGPEKDAFMDFLRSIGSPHPDEYMHLADPNLLNQMRDAEHQQQELEQNPVALAPPVHQIDTYHKRPKKLGFSNVSKESLMPEHSTPDQEVQYSKLHKMIKALTAGYGGADAPTSRTGGSVLQTEAMDSGQTFRYIDCPSCGKDQPYLKYQVKCRNCGKSFPFDTLAKFFISK